MSGTDLKFNSIVDSLMSGMSSFMSTKTVVGDPIVVGETIILPLVDMSFGVGVGTGTKEKGNSGCGGVGGKITPSAVLVISNGTTRLINVKNQDAFNKVLDMVPDIVNKITVPKKEFEEPEVSNETAVDMAFGDNNQ